MTKKKPWYRATVTDGGMAQAAAGFSNNLKPAKDKLGHHTRAVHGGDFDPACRACMELSRRAYAEETGHEGPA